MLFPGLPGLPLLFRLRSLGRNHSQEPVRRSLGYPHYQWIQVRAGKIRVAVGAVDETARPGDGLFLRPDEPHAYAAAPPGATVDWLCFDGPGVPEALSGGPLARSGVYRLTGADVVQGVLDRAWLWASDPGTPGSRLSACVYDLLMTLTEEAAGTGQASAAAGLGRLQPVLEALAHRPAYPWDASGLASLVGVTPQHLGRLFRQAFGQSPLEYLGRMRLRRALQLLVERPDLRVHEVGAAVGYPDTNYFVRLFRLREGLTPGEFRALHHGRGANPSPGLPRP